MRTCPYCLYRFPDDAPGCPRCENVLPVFSTLSKGAQAGQTTLAMMPARLATPSRTWLPLAIGGAVILGLVMVAIIFGPRLLGARKATPKPASTQSPSALATAAAGFPTPAPPSGWKQWLAADYSIKLWLPEGYHVVNFTVADWQNTYSSALAQDGFLRNEASKVRAGSARNTMLAGVSPRSDPATVRILAAGAASLAGAAAPKPEDLQTVVNRLGIDGTLKNTRALQPDRTCDSQVQMTQMEIIPSKLDDPNAWRGFVVAVNGADSAYVMVALVNPRDFSSTSDIMQKAVASLCQLPASMRPTPTVTSTPTPSSTPKPTSTPTPTFTPKPSSSPTPAFTPTSVSTSKPVPTRATTSTPSPTPSTTPISPLLDGWIEWNWQNKLYLDLPQTYTKVDFTIKDWQTVYSATLAQDPYLSNLAAQVAAGTLKDTMLVATSPDTEAVLVRVIVVNAPKLAGAKTPTATDVQVIIDKLGIIGRLSQATALEECGGQITRMELVPPAASRWGGSAIAATTARTGYVLVVLVSPQQATDRATPEEILGSLCLPKP